MSDELILRLFFDNSDAAAKIEEVNKMLEKLGINWFKNLDKVSKVVSNLLSLSKIDTRQAVTQVSNKPPEDDEKKEQKSWIWKWAEDVGASINQNPWVQFMYAGGGAGIVKELSQWLSKFFGESVSKVGGAGTGGLLGVLGGAFQSWWADSIAMDNIREGAPEYRIALKALQYFKEKGNPDADLIWNEYYKRMNDTIYSDELLEDLRGRGVASSFRPDAALDWIRHSDLGPKLDGIVWAYKHQAEAGELVNKVLGYLNEKLGLTKDRLHDVGDEFENSLKKYDDFIDKRVNKNVPLVSEEEVLKNTSDPFARPDYPVGAGLQYPVEAGVSGKILPSFKQFLAEGKLGDMADYDTSKQNEEFPPPSAELDKYEIDYPEKAPGSGFFGGLKESFQSEWKAMKKSFGIGGDKGLLGNLFGGKDTGGGLFGLLGSFAGPQGGILGTIQQFASMIPGIGGMISNIIGGIGTAFNALKSLFGGLSEEEKVAKDVTRDLGVSISEDLAKKIAETSKDVGDRFTAVIVGPVVQRCFAEAAA